MQPQHLYNLEWPGKHSFAGIDDKELQYSIATTNGSNGIRSAQLMRLAHLQGTI